MGLFISVTTASSELTDSAISKAILHLAATASGLARDGEVPSAPSLDITFMLPGKYDKPAFSGMRMGGYGAEEQTLHFQVAVPERVLGAELAEAYVEAVLLDVLDNASAFFTEHRVPFEAGQWRSVLAQLGLSVPPAKPSLRLVT